MGCGKSRVQDTEVQKKVELGNSGDIDSSKTKPDVQITDQENNNVPLEDADDSYSNTRLLLLGAAESGKTTLLEQIRLLYKQNYSETELFHRKSFTYNIIMQSIRNLIGMMKSAQKEFDNPENKQYCDVIMEEDEVQYACFRSDVAEAISRVWLDTAVQELYKSRSSINLNDSARYFLDSIERINKFDYKPTPQDLIMSYVPTVGVQNVVFQANKKSFQLFDIGGQKIDRRKWATMYDGIDAIFFCLAISEYDQTMTEDNNTNRLDDALCLLKKISEEKKFENIPLFLFCNEVDVFLEKLPHIPLNQYQTAYSGTTDEEALCFVENLAREVVSCRDPSLFFPYRTTCIDTDSMSKILEKVFTTILKGK
ncbi:unnamed protein product [Auanema sp. JU1783]|nr:unnamed protein product [Auanema sp. JU1783]